MANEKARPLTEKDIAPYIDIEKDFAVRLYRPNGRRKWLGGMLRIIRLNRHECAISFIRFVQLVCYANFDQEDLVSGLFKGMVLVENSQDEDKRDFIFTDPQRIIDNVPNRILSISSPDGFAAISAIPDDIKIAEALFIGCLGKKAA